MSAKRFHDQYTAGLLKVKTGMINQLWADELSLSLTYAKTAIMSSTQKKPLTMYMVNTIPKTK
jgi:hypothetical protein